MLHKQEKVNGFKDDSTCLVNKIHGYKILAIHNSNLELPLIMNNLLINTGKLPELEKNVVTDDNATKPAAEPRTTLRRDMK